jgi:transketolase
MRAGVGDALLALGHQNPRVMVVDADLASSLHLSEFAHKLPEQFIEVGVAEQNMIGIAAGLAKEGMTVFTSSYAAFSPGRTFDHIRVAVCYSQRNVKIIGGHTGLTVGPDGATHQMLEDIAMMRSLPNLTIVAPSDYASAFALTQQIAQLETPAYIRLSRVDTRTLTEPAAIKLGQALVLRPGNDLTIIASGDLVDRALQVAWQLAEKKIQTRVINLHTIKPLDGETIVKAAEETGAVVTLEDHQRYGGIGGAVAELLAEQSPVPMKIIGVHDTFGESGAADELLDKYGFGIDHLVNTLAQWRRLL